MTVSTLAAASALGNPAVNISIFTAREVSASFMATGSAVMVFVSCPPPGTSRAATALITPRISIRTKTFGPPPNAE